MCKSWWWSSLAFKKKIQTAKNIDQLKYPYLTYIRKCRIVDPVWQASKLSLGVFAAFYRWKNLHSSVVRWPFLNWHECLDMVACWRGNDGFCLGETSVSAGDVQRKTQLSPAIPLAIPWHWTGMGRGLKNPTKNKQTVAQVKSIDKLVHCKNNLFTVSLCKLRVGSI